VASNSAGGAVNISNATSSQQLRFRLLYFGSGSVYSSTNADTDWASCGHTAASFTGLGSVVSIETQCKRQGSDLLMKGRFTAGIPTAVEARLALPVWNGSQLVSAGTSIIPSLQLSGDMIYSSSNTVNFRHATLIEPSVSYMTFAYQSSTNAAFQKITGTTMTANNQAFSFSSRIPIEGWQGSNIIVGSFSGLESCASTLECTDTFSAKVSVAGVVSGENVDWISGNCAVASPAYTCSFNSAIFSVTPNCTATPVTNASEIRIASQSSSSISLEQYNSAGIAAMTGLTITCQKQGVDYIGKTAKAVASDQNLRTPGTANGVIHSFSMSSAGVVSSDFGSLVSSCNATAPYTCTFNASKFSSAPNCTCTNKTGNGKGCNVASTSTTNLVMASFNTATGASEAQPLGVVCHGVAP
jgi:hypothetical protein